MKLQRETSWKYPKRRIPRRGGLYVSEAAHTTLWRIVIGGNVSRDAFLTLPSGRVTAEERKFECLLIVDAYCEDVDIPGSPLHRVATLRHTEKRIMRNIPHTVYRTGRVEDFRAYPPYPSIHHTEPYRTCRPCRTYRPSTVTNRNPPYQPYPTVPTVPDVSRRIARTTPTAPIIPIVSKQEPRRNPDRTRRVAHKLYTHARDNDNAKPSDYTLRSRYT